MAIVLKRQGSSSRRDVLPDTAVLEEGDRVARVESSYSGLSAYFHTVTRVTPTQVVLDGNVRYRRDSGLQVGDVYASALYHVNHPRVLAAQQNMIMKAFSKKSGELLKLPQGPTVQDRIKALRSVELHARQAAERIELLEHQARESAAEMESVTE